MLLLPGILLLVAGGLFLRPFAPGPEETAPTHTVSEGLFEVWLPLSGTLESLRSENIVSSISQSTTILYLAPEGARVAPGDLVARFDSAALQQTLANLERDATLAASELTALQSAELPLQAAQLDNETAELAARLRQEEAITNRMRDLAERELISPPEFDAHQERLRRLQTELAAKEHQRDLTRNTLHPARIQQATAKRDTADRQLQLVREQIQGAEIRAGIPGTVVYLPLHIHGDYRTLREGDTVHRNQPFMQIADMSQPVVRCLVPEAGLSTLRPGLPAVITPDAFPDVKLPSEIIAIGSTARSMPGRPAWQKFFEVSLLLEEADPRLRTGMSVRAMTRTHHHPRATLLPRHLVDWADNTPTVRVLENGHPVRRTLEIDGGHPTHFHVRSGLQPGEQVLTPPMP